MHPSIQLLEDENPSMFKKNSKKSKAYKLVSDLNKLTSDVVPRRRQEPLTEEKPLLQFYLSLRMSPLP